jgi:tRNA G37 N-methylase TrmD
MFDETSTLTDLQDGLSIQDPPDYKVPEVLTSGNFAKIDKWRTIWPMNIQKQRHVRPVVAVYNL